MIKVSIPLKSGHIVTFVTDAIIISSKLGFNPLKVGSYCNGVGYLLTQG